MSKILTIPADNEGNKLFIKRYYTMNNRMFCMYKSTFNNMPFQETELFFADNNKNVVIVGDDGTVLWKFNYELLKSI